MVGPGQMVTAVDDRLLRTLAMCFLAWGAYHGMGVKERLSCVILGGLFSPNLGLFALVVWLYWAVPMGIRRAKAYIWQRISALICGPRCRDDTDLEQCQPQEEVSPPPVARELVQQRRRTSQCPYDSFIISLGGADDQQKEPLSFYG
jgi:hypothetical protein